ncbi:MAG: hypothetical protein FWD58_03300 [Firmicutes bacterium]|nr:hypothetical protein [Bacillota bacterium]
MSARLKLLEPESKAGIRYKRRKSGLFFCVAALVLLLLLGAYEAVIAQSSPLPSFSGVQKTAAELNADDSYLYWRHFVYGYRTVQRLEPPPGGMVNIVLDRSLSATQKNSFYAAAEFLNAQVFSRISDAYYFMVTESPMRSAGAKIYVRAEQRKNNKALGTAHVSSYPYYIVRQRARALTDCRIVLRSGEKAVAVHELMHCLLLNEAYSLAKKNSYDNGTTVMGSKALEFLYNADDIFISPNDLKLLYAAFCDGKPEHGIENFKNYCAEFESRFCEALVRAVIEYNLTEQYLRQCVVPVEIENRLAFRQSRGTYENLYEFSSDGRYRVKGRGFECSGTYQTVNGCIVFNEDCGNGDKNFRVLVRFSADTPPLYYDLYGEYLIIDAFDGGMNSLSGFDQEDGISHVEPPDVDQ